MHHLSFCLTSLMIFPQAPHSFAIHDPSAHRCMTQHQYPHTNTQRVHMPISDSTATSYYYRYALLNDGYVLRNASLGHFIVVRTS